MSDSYGDIDISPTAVASIVGQSVHQCYGVVGMARKGFVNGIAQLLSRDSSRRGVNVHLTDEGLLIDVYVILQYGVRIKVVAESIQRTVKYHVEKAMGQDVTAVNVYIQGLRLDEDDN
ncbi:MAG: Asp23/Gls24 family envelope stress response protein [Anaerolineales bacterium]|nr:Asp23/Gls24 family envelope stress response protein [Anaerolineales bacterium]